MEASNQIAFGASVRMKMSLMPWSLDWPTHTPCCCSAWRALCSAAAGLAAMMAAAMMFSNRPHDNECAHLVTRQSTAAAVSADSSRVASAVLRPIHGFTSPASIRAP